MSLVNRVAFPTTLAGVLLSSSVSSGASTISIRPTPSAAWSLQGSWKPGHQSFKAGLDWGVQSLHLSIQVWCLFPCKAGCSMHGGRELHPDTESGQSWNARLHLEDGMASQVFQFKYCSRLQGLLFWFIFAIVLLFLYKSSPADFVSFGLILWFHNFFSYFQLFSPSKSLFKSQLNPCMASWKNVSMDFIPRHIP